MNNKYLISIIVVWAIVFGVIFCKAILPEIEKIIAQWVPQNVQQPFFEKNRQ
jgi:hypothetical protein